AATAGLLAITLMTVALVHQLQVSRPVGEGELFVQEATAAAAKLEMMMEDESDLATTVRHLRNSLGIEAVALVSPNGEISAATSENLVGTTLQNGFLRFGLESERMAAVAGSTGVPISIDGVEEWSDIDVLYQVLQPLHAGKGSLLLYYDISQLLERRARESGIRSETLALLGAGVLLAVVAAVLLLGRARTARQYREMALEAEFLHREAAELEEHNRLLKEARGQAERALALAEEKNRIRAEFVLMINHELRTPLTSVVTGAELLRTATLSPTERDQIVADMIADGHRLQRMIAQMLVVARIENRGLNYVLRDVSLREVCAHIEARHPRITQEPVPDWADVRLRTDPDTLAQLVASLADNALTHGATKVELACSDGSPFQPMFQVGVPPEASAYLLVKDDGPGIDPEFLPRAFEKFEKHGRSSGTGLGLYMARLMTDALGGSLGVLTGPGGTTMAIAVPVVTASLERVPA
ncbi:MAG TPA: HAMP domain-containing sensor histidine kinase, partial [Acidimicrobiia bacterium]